MTTDIVERLREPWTEPARNADHEVQNLYALCDAAAGEIVRLRDEVRRERELRGELQAQAADTDSERSHELREVERLRAEVEALRADAVKWREVVPMLLDELDARDYRPGNAPGHSHDVPGVWDGDNGDLAGKPCAWCATWNAALKEHTNGR